ncbi:hypothetical protein XH81_26485, partial [Bradyrhizobium sp. CCBAU 25360]|uniref:hypothetical protein n=1 Tax=Bradyrhizobium sp. CCBAU 25360 TaxID=858425 RepID=UPI0023062DAF
VTTACLDPNPLDLVALQPLHQLLVASAVFLTCSSSELPSSATSSLSLLVSIPAQIVLRLAIFLDPPL